MQRIETGTHPSIIVKAGAAAGKTTFSKRFLLLCTSEMWGRHVTAPAPLHEAALNLVVPVLVFVVDLVKAIRKQREGTSPNGEPLLGHLRAKLHASHPQLFKLLLQAWLDGRMVLILDGWDELEQEYRCGAVWRGAGAVWMPSTGGAARRRAPTHPVGQPTP